MICLIYASAATRKCDALQLTEILKSSRKNNERLGLTGMLLHSQGNFLQVLEGEPEVVDTLYQTISADSRHAQLTQIIREPIARRTFADWTMGFSELSAEHLIGLDGMNDFFQNGSCFAKLEPGRAKNLLAAFAKGRWRAKLLVPTAGVA